jgi:hypothetical protein
VKPTTLGHLEQWAECGQPFVVRGIVVPLVDPDAAKTQVFEDEEAGRNF